MKKRAMYFWVFLFFFSGVSLLLLLVPSIRQALASALKKNGARTDGRPSKGSWRTDEPQTVENDLGVPIEYPNFSRVSPHFTWTEIGMGPDVQGRPRQIVVRAARFLEYVRAVRGDLPILVSGGGGNWPFIKNDGTEQKPDASDVDAWARKVSPGIGQDRERFLAELQAVAKDTGAKVIPFGDTIVLNIPVKVLGL